MKKKVIYWDIETSDLNADWGSIFCIGYAIDNGPTQLISIRDFPGWESEPWNDRKVIEAFLKVLNEVDVEVTHYGTNFDIKFLVGRMVAHKMKGGFPNLGHVDTYYIAKSKLAIKSRRLGRVAEHAGIKFKKTPLTPEVWKRAARGSEKDIAYIERHCIADIRVLRAVYRVLAPLLRLHPAIGEYRSCHVCGSSKLQNRGFACSTSAGIYQRTQCRKCGSWGRRRIGK